MPWKKDNEVRMVGSPVDGAVVDSGKAGVLPWSRFTYENL